MSRERFDPLLLDPNDPFELDDRNRPHLAKHGPFTEESVFDAWADPGMFFATAADDRAADWLMIADVGGAIVQVPLAPSHSGDPRRCRPIGVYAATAAQIQRYREENP
jgi:hypothetical protein